MRAVALISVLSFSLLVCSAAELAVTEKDIVYKTAGSTKLNIDFMRPSGEGPFPVIICIHGGAWREGSRKDFLDVQRALAVTGFASAAIQYRLLPKHKFPAQLEDSLDAIKFVAENAKRFQIDPARVGIFGGSAGGHLALLAGFSEIRGATVKCIVNAAGPTDLRSFEATAKDPKQKEIMKRDTDALMVELLGTNDKAAKIYETASPISFVKKGVPPVLTIHGTEDMVVPFSQATLLHEALKKAEVPEQLLAIQGAGHDMGGDQAAGAKVMLGMYDFLTKYLLKKD